MPHGSRHPACGLIPLAIPLTAVLFLAGCGMGPANTTTTVAAHTLQGIVHGGQQPVAGATIQLYTAGKTGNASAARPMITSTTVTTDTNGNFSISSDYTCNASTDQVYIVATGGNPGLTSGTYNNALVMMDPLGSCGGLNQNSFITINEVTTVAAAWALAPFMTSATNVGATSTNTLGLQNAFLDAQLLVNTGTGGAATLPASLSTQTGKLYALADAIATCVNSDGTSACLPLFTAATPPSGFSATVTAPTDTLSAALNIVKYPGNHITGVYNCISANPPFPTTLTAAPSDWTMALTITGSGLNTPTAFAIDSAGNAWVASYFGGVSAFTPQGAAFNGSPFASSTLSETYGLTIDPTSNIWITNRETPYHGLYGSIVEMQGASSASPGAIVTALPSGVGASPYIYDSLTDYPGAVAADTNGNIFIANYANSLASIYCPSGCSSGGYFVNSIGSGSASLPVALAVDNSHGVWLANQGNGSVTHVDAAGNAATLTNCCSGINSIALDSFGNAWASIYYASNVVEITLSGTGSSATASLTTTATGGGLAAGYPSGIAIDAAQNIWVNDYRANSFTELAGNSSYPAVGTPYSPATGYGRDAGLDLPDAIAPDASGNIWITNEGANNLVMFFGLATPTVTPLSIYPTAP